MSDRDAFGDPVAPSPAAPRPMRDQSVAGIDFEVTGWRMRVAIAITLAAAPVALLSLLGVLPDRLEGAHFVVAPVAWAMMLALEAVHRRRHGEPGALAQPPGDDRSASLLPEPEAWPRADVPERVAYEIPQPTLPPRL